MRDDVTLDDIRSLVGLQLGLARVGAGDDLVSDLGAESADLVNLVAAVEDKYGIAVGEDELPDLKTVKDLFERVRRT
jgi:acyl carrier protein